VGRTKAISGLAPTLDQPEFATAIGLVKYGSFQAASGRKRAPWFDRVKASLSQILSSLLAF
jgi:hypothetical protein